MTYSHFAARSRSLVRVLCLLLLSVGSLQELPAQIPATQRAREDFFASMPLDPANTALEERRILRVPGAGDVVLRMSDEEGSRVYRFLPLDDPEGPRADGPGAWVIRQRLSDGAFEDVRIYLEHDGASLLRISPRPGQRTLRMDVTLADTVFYRDINLPMTMERLLSAGFDEIRTATGGVVDWSIAFPDLSAPGYTRVAALVRAIREELPALPDAEDGALNRDGSFVFIETLAPMPEGGFNCSGFAKWVADGIYAADGGPLMSVDALRRKHLDARGTRWSRRVEDSRDPYFGLDWTRNIALQLYAREHGIDPLTLDPEERDVRSVPFVRYQEDVGYDTRLLRPILYWLASRAPGTIYFGSVNLLGGDDDVLRQHSHVVVFLPYFDGAGRFRVAVMERNQETDLASLARRYSASFTHLVRVNADRPFVLPPVPESSVRVSR